MKKLVTITGGSGGHVLLSGLVSRPFDITAICTTFDNGGHSGQIRGEFGLIPPGDLRQCLSALAAGEMSEFWKTVFMYRFEKDESSHLNGVSLGNVIMTAAFQSYGSEHGMKLLNDALNVTGKVWPVSFDNANLQVTFDDGSTMTGEADIDTRCVNDDRKIIKLSLVGEPQITSTAYNSIVNAEIIVLGPGDLYTSVLPNLLVGGMREALSKTKAQVIFVCNLMNKFAETGNSDSLNFLKIVNSYLPNKKPVDVMITNSENIPDQVLLKYLKEERSMQVMNVDIDQTKTKLRSFELVSTKALQSQVVRHDSQKLARAIMEVTHDCA